jgi:hypothetical protein
MLMSSLKRRLTQRCGLALIGAVAFSCSTSAKSGTQEAPAPTASPSKPAASSQAAPGAAVVAPTLADENAKDLPGAHNVVAFGDGFYSGSVPEGDEGFATLQSMGIKTVISVDGSAPEVEKAKARGMRYIHLPIGYNGFDDVRKNELARATQDALKRGPVYLHCHHGKHRSAGAAGTVGVSLGWLTPEQATARMLISGTAPDYTGLYACVANAAVVDPGVLSAVPANFPEISRPVGFVKSMVEIDEINEDLKSAEKAGWKAPADHPDLVPAAALGQMADHFRQLCELDAVKAKPADFVTRLRTEADQFTAMEEAMLKGADAKKLSEQFKAASVSCKDCHAKYRD